MQTRDEVEGLHICRESVCKLLDGFLETVFPTLYETEVRLFDRFAFLLYVQGLFGPKCFEYFCDVLRGVG